MRTTTKNTPPGSFRAALFLILIFAATPAAGHADTLTNYTNVVWSYTFDTGPGSFDDESPNNQDGVLLGGALVIENATCKFNGCIFFDGVNDYTNASTTGQNDNMTFAVWIKPIGTGTYRIFTQQNHVWGANNWATDYETNSLYMWESSGYWGALNPWIQNFPTGEWMFITARKNDNNFWQSQVFYENCSEAIYQAGTDVDVSGGAIARFATFTGGNFFKGYMDDARWYNISLDNTSIEYLCNSSKTKWDTPDLGTSQINFTLEAENFNYTVNVSDMTGTGVYLKINATNATDHNNNRTYNLSQYFRPGAYPSTYAVTTYNLYNGSAADLSNFSNTNIVNESGGVEGDIYINWSDLGGQLDQINLSLHYDGAGGHAVYIMAYNYTAGDWATVDTLLDEEIGTRILYFNRSADFVNSSGAASLLIWHDSPGNAGHTIQVYGARARVTSYTMTDKFYNLGYGNFSAELVNGAEGVITSKILNINITFPVLVHITDQVTGAALGSIDFTIRNRNITNATEWGEEYSDNYTTNATGRQWISLYRFGDFSTAELTAQAVTGYYDASLNEALGDSPPTRIIEFELESVGGAGQVILIIKDLLTYQPIEDVNINTTSGHGQHLTDTWGKVSIVGAIGEIIQGSITLDGYVSRNFSMEIFTREETYYLARLNQEINESISCQILPEADYLDRDQTHYLFIRCTSWDRIKNVTVVIADGPELLAIYEQYGLNVSGELETFYFNFDAMDWCNISTLCIGDSSFIQWRPTDKTLNSYGVHVTAGADVYDLAATRLTFRRAGFFIVAKDAISGWLQAFSPEQRAWAGLFILLSGTFSVAVGLSLTFYMAGVLACLFMVFNVVFGLWPMEFIIIPGVLAAFGLLSGAFR